MKTEHTDTERLDWLEKQGCVELVHISGIMTHTVAVRCDDGDMGRGPTLRAAIDKGMLEETPDAAIAYAERDLRKAQSDLDKAYRNLEEAKRQQPRP